MQLEVRQKAKHRESLLSHASLTQSGLKRGWGIIPFPGISNVHHSHYFSDVICLSCSFDSVLNSSGVTAYIYTISISRSL